MKSLLKINNSLVRAKVAPDPPIAPKETWVINDTYSSAIEFTVSSLNFISNGKNFTSIAIRIAPVGSAYIKYNNTTVNNIMVNTLATGIRGQRFGSILLTALSHFQSPQLVTCSPGSKLMQ